MSGAGCPPGTGLAVVMAASPAAALSHSAERVLPVDPIILGGCAQHCDSAWFRVYDGVDADRSRVCDVAKGSMGVKATVEHGNSSPGPPDSVF